MKCVNIKHPDFIKLVVDLNLSTAKVAAMVSLWQQKNNTDKIPTKKQLLEEEDSKVQDFLESMKTFLNENNIQIEHLDDYMDSYKKRNNLKDIDLSFVSAITDASNRIIALSDFNNLSQLSEEVGHMALAFTPRTNLFEKALELVETTSLYKEQHSNYLKAYKKTNPNLNDSQLEQKVKLEVLGQLLGETFENEFEAKRKNGNTLISILRQLFKKFVNLFETNSLKKFLNSITQSVYLNTIGNELQDSEVYFNIDENVEDLTEDQRIIRNIIKDQKLRLKKLKERGLLKTREELKALTDELEKNQNVLGLNIFLDYLMKDSKSVLKYKDKIKNSGEIPSDLTVKQLGDFIHYYKSSLVDLRRNIELLDKQYQEILLNQINIFNDIEDFYVDIQNKRVIESTNKFFKDSNITPDFDIEKVLKEPGKEVNQLQYLFGNIRDVLDPIARTIYAKMGNLLYEVYQKSYIKGKELVRKSFDEFNIKSTAKFAERDSKGKTTGYYLSKYKMADFWNEYDKGRKELDKLKTDEEKKQYWEKWKQNNIERRFIKDYYEHKNKLSVEAQEALDLIDVKILSIMNKYRREDLSVNVEDLSEKDWSDLEAHYIERKGLASEYDDKGERKTGTLLQIALDISAFNKVLYENVTYKADEKKFNEVKQQKGKSLAPEKYKLWLERNTQIEYDQKFWEELASIERMYYGERYAELNEKKNKILRQYKSDGINTLVSYMTDEVVEEIKSIDDEMRAIRESTEPEKRDTLKVSDIAEFPKTDQYYIDRQKAVSQGIEKEWTDKHHYYDSKGARHPYSYYTKIVPKNKEYIKLVPSFAWKEVDPESNWHNKNYDRNHRGLQPILSKYSNESEYNKLSPNEQQYLNFLLSEKWKADDLMNVSNNNGYLLPQVTSSLMDVLYQGSHLLSNLKGIVKEGIERRVEDEELFGSLKNAYTSDGNKINYTLKKYTRKLENPELVSTDLLASLVLYHESALQYKTMTNNAASFENLQEQLGNRKFIKKDKILLGKETNLYKMVQSFLDAELYGINLNDRGQVNFLGLKVDISKTIGKFNSYIRGNNLISNFYSMSANLIGGNILSNIDAIIGRYTTVKSTLYATKELAIQMPKILLEYNDPNKSNKLSLILEYFNVVKTNTDLFDNLDKTAIKRLTPEQLLYSGWEQGGYYIRAKTALAHMFNQRYNPELKIFQTEAQFEKTNPKKKYTDLQSIYDMLDIKDNTVVINSEYQNIISKEYLAKLNATLAQRVTYVDGNITNLDRSVAHRSVWWSLVTLHRNWLIDGLSRRFKGTSKNLLTDYTETGWYRYYFTEFIPKVIMQEKKLRDLKRLFSKEVWNTLEPHEKEAVYKVYLDMAIVVVLSVIAVTINNLAEDDEELEWAAYLSNRVLIEMSALSPTPIAIPELLAVVNSPVAGVRQIETLVDLRDLFSDREIEKGKFEGLTERERVLIKLMPGLKGYYMSSDPASSNQFLKQKPLKWLYNN